MYPDIQTFRSRYGTDYLYKRVPQERLEAFHNRKFIRQSPRTKNLSETKVKLLKELIALDKEFDQLAKSDHFCANQRNHRKPPQGQVNSNGI